MDMQEFSKANAARCKASDGFNHTITDWSHSDWLVAVLGELGEAANVLKKLNRVRDGIPGNSESEEELLAKLETEIADTFIYLDLFAQASGFSLAEAVKNTWNKKSEKLGYPVRLYTPSHAEGVAEVYTPRYIGIEIGGNKTIYDQVTKQRRDYFWHTQRGFKVGLRAWNGGVFGEPGVDHPDLIWIPHELTVDQRNNQNKELDDGSSKCPDS